MSCQTPTSVDLVEPRALATANATKAFALLLHLRPAAMTYFAAPRIQLALYMRILRARLDVTA